MRVVIGNFSPDFTRKTKVNSKQFLLLHGYRTVASVFLSATLAQDIFFLKSKLTETTEINIFQSNPWYLSHL